MRLGPTLLALLGSAGFACGDIGPGPQLGGDARPPGDGGPGPVQGPCDPPLELLPQSFEVTPGELRTVTATGGTGRYRFALAEAPSGARINPRTGAYLSGRTPGVTDRIRLTDEACVGEATGEARVVSAFRVEPAAIELRPGEAFAFRAEGGSGSAEFRLARTDSGGTLTTDGRYTAGDAEGIDVVEATDPGVRQTAQAVVTVTATPRFSVRPAWVGLTVGGALELEVDGGSGGLELGSGDGVTLRGDRTLVGVEPGRHAIELRDPFLDRSATITVEVAGPLEYDATRAGTNDRGSRIELADLDGDGRADLVLGHPEADIAAHDGGAVFVFAGTDDGFATTPRWTAAGAGRDDGFGGGLALADLDGDGAVDLLVGAPFEDRNGRGDAGAVRLYRGTGDGFETEPAWEIAGRESERLGAALAVCDFNGDGRLDVAVGRPRATDRRRADVRFGQGAVSVYLGRADGLPGEPDVERFGDVPVDGGWVGQSVMELGEAVAAGDVDGDGLCDLAAGAPRYDRPGSFDDGLVALFLGRARDGNDLGGLTVRPVALWSELDEADRGSNFGADLELADLSGDGVADVVVGQPGRDLGPSDRQGAVRIFVQPSVESEAQSVRPASEAQGTVTGSNGFDELGRRVRVARVDGDARPDLIVGAPQAEGDGAPPNAGGVLVFLGAVRGVVSDTPAFAYWGVGQNDRVGTALGVAPDFDGDAVPDVVAMAATRSEAGIDVGALYAFGSAGAAPATWVWPGEPSGMEYGSGAAIAGDLTGNGFDDVVVGAPRLADDVRGRDTGRFWIHEGTAEGVPTAPSSSYRGHELHSGFDWFGAAAAGAGDFDGDGRDDLVVVARFEDQPAPTSFDGTYVVSATCTGSRNNSGAAFVYRGRAGGRLPQIAPDFILFGPVANAGVDALAGGGDLDGDGRADFVLGVDDATDGDGRRTGGVAIYRGRDRGLGLTVVDCAPDAMIFGADDGSGFGRAIAHLGDLDGDGCGELGVGAPQADPGLRDGGTLTIIWGAGGAGCPATPGFTVLAGTSNFSNFGTSVAGGVDLDGDGRPDVVVGEPRAENPERVGAVHVLSGRELAALPRGRSPDATPISIDAVPGGWRAFSSTVDGRFGETIAVGVTDERGFVAVGEPRGDVAGVLVGGVQLYGLVQGNLQLLGSVAGGSGPGARFGDVLSAGRGGLLAGSRFDSAVFLDGGAVYRFGVEGLFGP